MAPATSPRSIAPHWVYMDDRRTHEVHAEVEARPDGTVLLTTEFPAGSLDPIEVVQEARRVAAQAELQAHLLDLENRLRLSGTYFRLDTASMKWTPLGGAPPDARVDLRAVELPIPGAPAGTKMGFHHFHEGSGRDRLLITMPRSDMGASRHVLAELNFRFPDVTQGDLHVLHTRMTPSLLRTNLVREHIEMPRRGFAKLIEPVDYQRTFGERWMEGAREMWRGATNLFLGSPRAPAPEAPRQAPLAASRLDQVREALQDPHVLALKREFAGEHELELALKGGEHSIRRLVQGKRRRFDHSLAYDLTILESALLLEYALRADVASLIEEESDKLLRFVRGFHRRAA